VYGFYYTESITSEIRRYSSQRDRTKAVVNIQKRFTGTYQVDLKAVIKL